jgi:outer membrane protein TolC
MPERLLSVGLLATAVLVLAPAAPAVAQERPDTPPAPAAAAPASPTLERVTFQEAVSRALEHQPTVAQAVEAIRRSQALLQQAHTVFEPLVTGFVGETIIDSARGFDGSIVVPQKQAAFSATVSFQLLDVSGWASAKHAADQVEIARLSANDVRRQVAVTAAQAYILVLAAQHQREIAVRNRDTAQTLADYAKTRLEAGQGSRLNYVRAVQEMATAEGVVQAAELAVHQAREALGVAVFADAPVDVNGEPEFGTPAPPSEDETRIAERTDLRVFNAQAEAADRILSDNWKSWLPTATASFTPQYVTPAGLFEQARTWRALFQLQVPIFDGSLGAGRKLATANRETARLSLLSAQVEARAEVRSARVAVQRNEQIAAAAREAASNAAEALRITEVAYRAGGTTNAEVVQAQQTSRRVESQAALAQDRLLQARLELLVALGQFP